MGSCPGVEQTSLPTYNFMSKVKVSKRQNLKVFNECQNTIENIREQELDPNFKILIWKIWLYITVVNSISSALFFQTMANENLAMDQSSHKEVILRNKRSHLRKNIQISYQKSFTIILLHAGYYIKNTID